MNNLTGAASVGGLFLTIRRYVVIHICKQIIASPLANIGGCPAISSRDSELAAAESISILLVEDEALLQTLMEEWLKDAGFAVSMASRGIQGITMLDSPGSDYRALVTDIHLGDDPITGWDVARHARELHPDLPVIYMTGGGADEWASQGVSNSVLVKKPFEAAQVITAVTQLLNQGNTRGA